MAEINHKWTFTATIGRFTEYACKRCGLLKRVVGPANFRWLVDGEWKSLRVQPECDPRPKSERS